MDTVIKTPQHPYTRLLVDSIPWPNLNQRWGTDTIKARESGGSSVGCPFQSRCPVAMEECKVQPPLFQMHPSQAASCYLHAANPPISADKLSNLLPA